MIGFGSSYGCGGGRFLPFIYVICSIIVPVVVFSYGILPHTLSNVDMCFPLLPVDLRIWLDYQVTLRFWVGRVMIWPTAPSPSLWIYYTPTFVTLLRFGNALFNCRYDCRVIAVGSPQYTRLRLPLICSTLWLSAPLTGDLIPVALIIRSRMPLCVATIYV